jgi:hypothetical protein
MRGLLRVRRLRPNAWRHNFVLNQCGRDGDISPSGAVGVLPHSNKDIAHERQTVSHGYPRRDE